MLALVGLVLALVGPAVIAIAGKLPLANSNPVLFHVASVLAIALVVFGVFVSATRIERIPLMRFGFAAVSWWTPVVAAVLALFFITVFGPWAYWLLAELGLGSFETGASMLAKLPRWYLLLTIVIVAAAEELLYRAYAIERLAELTGSYLIAGIISVLAFGLAHVPLWGWGPAATTFVSGAIMTLLYIWRRDVVALMIAHVATDVHGLVVAPLLSGLRRADLNVGIGPGERVCSKAL